jgi:NNP family nitrate/nitrite transporter-like MFS transporter
VEYKRRAAAVIGIAGAVGAFGGFLIQVSFRRRAWA